MAPDSDSSASASASTAASTSTSTKAPRKRASKSKQSAVASRTAKPTLVHGQNVPLFQTSEQAAKGIHPHTNVPRRDEIRALAPKESPSNAHKSGVPAALSTVAPLDSKGPIGGTAMGPKAASKAQKTRAKKVQGLKKAA